MNNELRIKNKEGACIKNKCEFSRYSLFLFHYSRKGMSIMEIVIYLTLFVIITTAGILALNPGGQLAAARNNERTLHLQAIMNSIRQNIADQAGGTFSCASGAIPTSTKTMATGAGNYDIAPCLIPNYLNSMPFDPSTSTAHWTSVTDYNTGYKIIKNATSGEITVSAPSAELGKIISIIR